MLRYLKEVFPIVSILILSVIFTPNILDYIWIFLKLLLSSRIYRLSLDWPNVKYMIYFIQKSGFWDLAFLIFKDNLISGILKIIVFIDKIKGTIKLERYLWSRLLDCIRNRS